MPKNKVLKKKKAQMEQMRSLQEAMARQEEKLLLLTEEIGRQQDILRKYSREYQQLKDRRENRYLMTYIRMRESMMEDMAYYREHGRENTRGYSLLEMYVNEYTELLEDEGVEVLECRENTAFDPMTQKPTRRVPVSRMEFDNVVLKAVFKQDTTVTEEMTKEQIGRINELACTSRERALTDEEKAEQAALRRQYIDEFKANVKATLDNTWIQEPDGTRRPLRQKEPEKK